MVHPGADPAQIRLAYRGATNVALNAAGQLEVTTPLGGFTDDIPAAYQEIDGRRVPVEMDYRLLPAAGIAGEHVTFEGTTFNFAVGDYDPTHPFILAPAVLVYSGFIREGSDGWGIAVDSAGNAYVTGDAASDYVDGRLIYDAFVAKVNTAGTAFDYVSFLGGSDSDYGLGRSE